MRTTHLENRDGQGAVGETGRANRRQKKWFNSRQRANPRPGCELQPGNVVGKRKSSRTERICQPRATRPVIKKENAANEKNKTRVKHQ
jgi:hypothetical protein